MSDKESLIAYNTLKRKIIKNGFCTMCGTCEAACPTQAIQVENEVNRHIHDCSKDMDLCPICYEVCPHSEALLLRTLKFVSDAPIRSEALGFYRKIVLAQAADSNLRQKSLGGGVVTSLLMYGIREKLFDSAIVSKGDTENPVLPQASVASVPDDILSAVGSKFFPSAVARAYGSAVFSYGKSRIAFVGVPCHILGLRKLEAWKHKLGNNLALTIGLFCFGTFSTTPLLDFLEQNYGIKSSEIKQMRLGSKFVVQTADKAVRIPLEEVEAHVMPSCRTCTDFTNELADISIGGAYPLEDWSTVIIRTKLGDDFFYGATEKGILNTWVIEHEPTVYERLVLASIQKNSEAIKAAKELREVYKYDYVPTRIIKETEALANVKVQEIMTTKLKTVAYNMRVNELAELMIRQHHMGYPVLNDRGEPIGVVTLEECAIVEKENRQTTQVYEIMRRRMATVFPGDTALDAYNKMNLNETGHVLVVDPTDPKKLLGMVTKADLMHALLQQY